MNYAQLKTEYTTDPVGVGYAPYVTVKAYGALAYLINNPNASWTKTVPQVPLTSVLKWAGAGPLQKLTDYANNTGNNAALRSICLAALQLFAGAMPYLDLSDSGNLTMVQSLVSGGVLSATDQSNLLALQTVSPASRAEVLFGAGTVVTPKDAEIALNS